MIRALWNWIKQLFHHAQQDPITGAGAAEWHPSIRAALEQQRQQQIIKRLRQFFNQRPRPWRMK